MSRRKTSNLRCYFYDDEGRPRSNKHGGLGCERDPSECHFIHPDEPEWRTARTTKRDPPRPREERRNWRDRPPSPAPSHRSEHRRSSDQYDMPRERRASGDSTSMRGWGRASSPARSDLSLGPRSRSKESIDPMTSDTHVSHMPPPPIPAPSAAASSSSAPPPAATAVTSTPTTPLDSKEGTAGRMTVSERRDVWKTRIQVMTDCVLARAEHVKLQRELRQYEALMQSWRFSELAEDDKARLRAQVSEVRDKCEKKKGELNKLVESLINSDYWPASKDKQGLSSLDNVRKEVSELKELCANLRTELVQVITNQAAVASAAAEKEEDGSQTKGKRRRLSESGRDTDDRHATGSRRVQEQVENLEQRLVELENMLNQRDAELLDELEGRLEAMLEDVRETQSRSVAETRQKEHEAYGARIQGIEFNLNVTGDQVTAIAQEIATLITESADLRSENVSLKQENEKWKMKVVELEAKQRQTETVIQRHRDEIRALSVAVADQAVRTSKIQPTLPPESVVNAIQEPIFEAVRAMVRSEADDLRRTLAGNIQQGNTEIYTTVWSKLSKVLQVVEGLKKTAENLHPPLENT